MHELLMYRHVHSITWHHLALETFMTSMASAEDPKTYHPVIRRVSESWHFSFIIVADYSTLSSMRGQNVNIRFGLRWCPSSDNARMLRVSIEEKFAWGWQLNRFCETIIGWTGSMFLHRAVQISIFKCFRIERVRIWDRSVCDIQTIHFWCFSQICTHFIRWHACDRRQMQSYVEDISSEFCKYCHQSFHVCAAQLLQKFNCMKTAWAGKTGDQVQQRFRHYHLSESVCP